MRTLNSTASNSLVAKSLIICTLDSFDACVWKKAFGSSILAPVVIERKRRLSTTARSDLCGSALRVAPHADRPRRPAGLPGNPVISGKGLVGLPDADDGNILFDMDGIQDSIAGTKLEFLFGACYHNSPGGKPLFQTW